MRAYLEDFEATHGLLKLQTWTCIETTHRRSHEDARQVYVPRQLGSDDCGVYVCIFADLISQKRQLSDAEQEWIANAREALRKQLLEKQYHKTTPEPYLATEQDDYTAFTNINRGSATRSMSKDGIDMQQGGLRRSRRERRTRGYLQR